MSAVDSRSLLNYQILTSHINIHLFHLLGSGGNYCGLQNTEEIAISDYCPIYFLPRACRCKLAIQITLVQLLYCIPPLK